MEFAVSSPKKKRGGGSTISRVFRKLCTVMQPYLKNFQAGYLLMGGSICKSHTLFLPVVREHWEKNNLTLPVIIVDKTEEVNIIGSSQLFKRNFW